MCTAACLAETDLPTAIYRRDMLENQHPNSTCSQWLRALISVFRWEGVPLSEYKRRMGGRSLYQYCVCWYRNLSVFFFVQPAGINKENIPGFKAFSSYTSLWEYKNSLKQVKYTYQRILNNLRASPNIRNLFSNFTITHVCSVFFVFFYNESTNFTHFWIVQ